MKKIITTVAVAILLLASHNACASEYVSISECLMTDCSEYIIKNHGADTLTITYFIVATDSPQKVAMKIQGEPWVRHSGESGYAITHYQIIPPGSETKVFLLPQTRGTIKEVSVAMKNNQGKTMIFRTK